jgi:hypothetical protein
MGVHIVLSAVIFALSVFIGYLLFCWSRTTRKLEESEEARKLAQTNAFLAGELLYAAELERRANPPA